LLFQIDVPEISDTAAAYEVPTRNSTPSSAFDHNAESSTTTNALLTFTPSPWRAAPTNPFPSTFVRRSTNDTPAPVVPPLTCTPETALPEIVASSNVTSPPANSTIPDESSVAKPPP
jgi:hypothetical protein